MKTPPILTPPPPESTLPPKMNSGLKWGVVIGVAVVGIVVILLLGFLIILGEISPDEKQASAGTGETGFGTEGTGSSDAEEEDASTCPRGHRLVAHRITESYYCDICRRTQPIGARMLGCRTCNWDKCEKCASGTTNRTSLPVTSFGNFTPTRAISAPRAPRRIDLKLPPLRKGLDNEYFCGTGYGQVRIRTYGTDMPIAQQQYFAAKGPYMIEQFKRITGFAPPQGFYYSICFFKRPSEYLQLPALIGPEAGGMALTNPAYCIPGGLISHLMVSTDGTTHTTDVVTHEMIHAIAIASYGDFPICFDEGIADWLADSYRKRTPNPSNFYFYANVKFLEIGIKSGEFPSLDRYLACESYEDWGRLLPDVGVGYNIGAMLLDHLWNHHRQFLLKALAHCRQFDNNIPTRSKAFRSYVGKNWPGGWRDLDRRFQNWILDRAKYNWVPDK